MRNLSKKQKPSAALYLQTGRETTDKPMLSLADQLELGTARFGGEATSDGSATGRASLRLAEFSMDGNYRHALSGACHAKVRMSY